jgi:cytochrome c-type biogenesis protein CcmH
MKMQKTLRDRTCLAVLVAAAFVAVSAQPVFAQSQDDALRGPREPHPAANEAIARLKSPYCPGLMLEVCTSYTGGLLRDSIQALAYEGLTTDELVEWMLARHGEEYLAYPRASGTGLLAWLFPPIALALGIVAVVGALRYMRRGAPDVETVTVEVSAEEEELLREAMKEMDSSEEPVF